MIVSWTNISSDSNIFNDFLMVGLTSIFFMIIAFRKEIISKFVGSIFIVTFILYITYRVISSV